MKLIRTLLASLALASIGVAASASAAEYDVDGVHSSVIFKVRHNGVAPFYGRFNKVNGTFSFDAANATAAKLSFQIDVDSIFTAEKKRDDHLKSPDFFNAKQFPTITFTSRAVKAGAKPDTYTVDGDLTVRGVTKPISIELTKTGQGKNPMGGESIGFEGTFVLNRLDYGVSYAPDGLGRDVTVIVAVEGIKKG